MRYFPCFSIVLCICSMLFATTFIHNAVAQESDKPAQGRGTPDTTQEAKLTIKAIPWATVSIDDKRVGTTPVQKKVSPGTHVIQVRLPPQKKQYTTNITIENLQAIELIYDFNNDELTQKEMTYDPSLDTSNEEDNKKSSKKKNSKNSADARERTLDNKVELNFDTQDETNKAKKKTKSSKQRKKSNAHPLDSRVDLPF